MRILKAVKKSPSVKNVATITNVEQFFVGVEQNGSINFF